MIASAQLLTPVDVARLFRVDPKTVTRWAAAGRLPCLRTPGGHFRFDAGAIYAQLGATDNTAASQP
jgi:excisionase family DNA binding protein